MHGRHSHSRWCLAVCKTCVHAENAGHLTQDEDLYICRALVPPLRDYTASETPEFVLVKGCANACIDHYERDEAVYDDFITREVAWDKQYDHPSSIPLHSLLDATSGRLW